MRLDELENLLYLEMAITIERMEEIQKQTNANECLLDNLEYRELQGKLIAFQYVIEKIEKDNK